MVSLYKGKRFQRKIDSRKADDFRTLQAVSAYLSCRKERKSKTEATFFPPPGVKYEDAYLGPIAVDNGEITLTKTFKLLVSTLAYDRHDNDAIECMI